MNQYQYIRFLTEEAMRALNNYPNREKKYSELWETKWFGQIPLSIKLLFKKAT